METLGTPRVQSYQSHGQGRVRAETYVTPSSTNSTVAGVKRSFVRMLVGFENLNEEIRQAAESQAFEKD